MYQAEPYEIAIIQPFSSHRTWQVPMVEPNSSTFMTQTFESKVWPELLKTHLGLIFIGLSTQEHLQSVVHDSYIPEMFVEMK